jgi:intraflagellar transport protein 122
LLKFTHTTTIQALAYNSVTQQLASGSEVDFGLWSPEVRSVPKRPVTSRILCMAWTPDGCLLAMGLEDGRVSLRDKAGEQRSEFSRGPSPVWSVAFPPDQTASQLRNLVVAGWDGKLAFYEVC